jgi:hypothetical protein
MTAMSLVWIARHPRPRRQASSLARRRFLARGGRIPGALSLLRQFRAGAVVLHVPEGRGWEAARGCSRPARGLRS